NMIQTIRNFHIININPQEKPSIARLFYYPDTSQYYFLNKNTFRDKIENENNSELNNDYLLFDPNNNYHLSQAHTLNSFNNLMRILGIHDDLLADNTNNNNNNNKNNVSVVEYLKNIEHRTLIDFNDRFDF